MSNWILYGAVLLAVVSLANCTKTCSVRGPSLVTPFQGGDPFRLAMPCRYQLTDAVIPRGDYTCRARIFASGIKINGMFYVNSVDLRLYINGDDFLSVKAYGKFDEETQTFSTDTLVRNTEYGKGDNWTRSTDISNLDSLFPGTTNIFEIDDNGLVTFETSACGLKIQFLQVSYDLSNANQAGVTVEIPDDVDIFYDGLESACFANCMAPSDVATLLGTSNALDAMTYQVATHWRKNSGHTNADTDSCKVMKYVTSNCPFNRRPDAVRACMFILTNSKFVSCFESDYKSTELAMAFNSCVDAFCDKDNTSGCKTVDKIVGGSCDLPAFHPCISR